MADLSKYIYLTFQQQFTIFDNRSDFYSFNRVVHCFVVVLDATVHHTAKPCADDMINIITVWSDPFF